MVVEGFVGLDAAKVSNTSIGQSSRNIDNKLVDSSPTIGCEMNLDCHRRRGDRSSNTGATWCIGENSIVARVGESSRQH